MRVKNWKKFQHFKDRKPPWVKLYRDILDDHEWHQLDGESAKTLVMLWLLASESGDGSLPEIAKIAWRLRVTEKSIKTTVSKLSHWLEQDDDGAISPGYQETRLEKRERQSTETEKETEGDGRRKRRTTIPDDFELTEAMRDFALSRHPDMDTAGTFAAFKDFHTNKGTLGLDWEAGWRTWVTNAERFGYVRAKRREQVAAAGRKVAPSEVFDRQPNRPGAVHDGVVAGKERDGGRDDSPLGKA